MKHRFLSKRYWKDITTPMGKLDGLVRQFDDIINLSLGDPDLITHDIIIDGAFADAKRGHTRYTDYRGYPELRDEIRAYFRDEHGLRYDDAEVMVCTSGCLAMFLVMEALLDDGDEVIIHAPYFTPYLQQIQLARGVPVVLDTFEKDDFQIDFDRLESLVTERTKAMIVNSPNNPTGNCFSLETLQSIANFAERHDIVVVADDIYDTLSFQAPFTPFATLPGMKERTVTINSFSKDYSMTGWRIGAILAPDYITKTVQLINENVAFTAPSISQRGAIYALRNRKTIQPAIIEEYRRRAYYAYERIRQIPNISVMEPRGTFYLFPNIKQTGWNSIDACEHILREAHVLTLPGTAFGACGDGYLRLALTVGVDTLAEAFDRIEKMPAFAG